MKKELRSLTQAKARIIFLSIWMVIALLLFFVGMSVYLGAEERAFVDWVVWGTMCCVPVIGTVLRAVITSAKSGWNEGANQYSATVSNNSVTVQNHPFRQAVLSVIAAILVCVLVGPVMLGIFVIINITKNCRYARFVLRLRQFLCTFFILSFVLKIIRLQRCCQLRVLHKS